MLATKFDKMALPAMSDIKLNVYINVIKCDTIDIKLDELLPQKQ